MIQVKNIVKQFEGVTVLNDISADFKDGQVNMIIGQSGSGKTVLMKTMLGLFKPDGGEILLVESEKVSNLAQYSEKEMRMYHRQVGTLFQGAALFDSQTVLENVPFDIIFSNISIPFSLFSFFNIVFAFFI